MRIGAYGAPGLRAPRAGDVRMGRVPVTSPRTARIAVVGAVCTGLGHVVVRGPHLVDDAFITFRYSANLADGLGLVFTRGQRVEGFSNPLWTILLALPARLGISLPGAAVVLGTTF